MCVIQLTYIYLFIYLILVKIFEILNWVWFMIKLMLFHFYDWPIIKHHWSVNKLEICTCSSIPSISNRERDFTLPTIVLCLMIANSEAQWLFYVPILSLCLVIWNGYTKKYKISFKKNYLWVKSLQIFKLVRFITSNIGCSAHIRFKIVHFFGYDMGSAMKGLTFLPSSLLIYCNI